MACGGCVDAVGVGGYRCAMSVSDAGTPAPGSASESQLKSIDEIHSQIEANRRAAERLFVPSPVIERLQWQVCGAWETVIEEVRFFHYALAEDPPTDPPVRLAGRGKRDP